MVATLAQPYDRRIAAPPRAGSRSANLDDMTAPHRPIPSAQASEPAPDVLHIAALARLDIDPSRREEVAAQFARILQAFRKLTTLDVEGVEPMTRPLDATDVLRDDRERPGLSVDAALANAPERIEDFYSVPKTLGGDA